MKKRLSLFVILISSFQLTCADTNNIPQSINTDEFQGFNLEDSKTALSGYEYTTGNRTSKSIDVTFTSCEQALNYDINKVIAFEYFRFKLLLTSCEAINKYKTAKGSNITYFQKIINDSDYKNFPSLTTPFLSDTDYNQRTNKTIDQSYKKYKITTKKNKATLITKEDEIYITILARGDFNNDKIEDLLVSSEWYARNAFGKHTDLVILSKKGKEKPVTILWRLNKPK